MVDVSAKPDTERVAVAEGHVVMTGKTLDLIVCHVLVEHFIPGTGDDPTANFNGNVRPSNKTLLYLDLGIQA